MYFFRVLKNFRSLQRPLEENFSIAEIILRAVDAQCIYVTNCILFKLSGFPATGK